MDSTTFGIRTTPPTRMILLISEDLTPPRKMLEAKLQTIGIAALRGGQRVPCIPKDEMSSVSTPVNNAHMCTSVPATLEKQSMLTAMVKERISQRSVASGSMRKHGGSMRSPRSP